MNKTANDSVVGVGSTIKRAGLFFRNNRIIKVLKNKKTILTVPMAAVITAIVMMSLTFNVSYAVAVSYNGETVGYVSSYEVYDAAVDKIASNTDETVKSCLEKTQVKDSVTAGVTVLFDEEDLTDALLESMPNVTRAALICKNGELLAPVKDIHTAQAALQKYLSESSAGLTDCEYIDELSVIDGYCANDELLGLDGALLALRANVDIRGTRTVEKTVSVEYKTERTESDKLLSGETSVTQKGKCGKNRVTALQEVVNGKVVEETVQATAVLSEPVDEKITVGTAKLGGASLSFPLSLSSGYSITSHFGEYRAGVAHLGTDIVVAYGTKIHAAAGGTVEEAGYSPYGWGNTVLINHGNGLKTRYAHCSSVSVSVGQTVTRGDVVGLVGSTGDSDCNHLHFEAYVNGERVDAMQFVK